MNGKRRFSTELAYLCGIFILAVGTVFMEKADYGMSMVVAPAYLIYLKISETVNWFTFGMSEYCFQAILILVLSTVLKKFKISYLFSFCTAVFYGVVLDICMAVFKFVTCDNYAARTICFLIGMIFGSIGVSFLFHTYVAPEAYELVVKEIASRYNKDIHKVKTAHDCLSCILAILLSFMFYGIGTFKGVKGGTIICAMLNGWMISKASKVLNKYFEFYNMKNK